MAGDFWIRFNVDFSSGQVRNERFLVAHVGHSSRVFSALIFAVMIQTELLKVMLILLVTLSETVRSQTPVDSVIEISDGSVAVQARLD